MGTSLLVSAGWKAKYLSFFHKNSQNVEVPSKSRLSLLPDDHSRVILECTHSEPHTDYINANYIDVSIFSSCSWFSFFSVTGTHLVVVQKQKKELFSCFLCLPIGRSALLFPSVAWISFIFVSGLQETQCIYCYTRYTGVILLVRKSVTSQIFFWICVFLWAHLWRDLILGHPRTFFRPSVTIRSCGSLKDANHLFGSRSCQWAATQSVSCSFRSQ